MSEKKDKTVKELVSNAISAIQPQLKARVHGVSKGSHHPTGVGSTAIRKQRARERQSHLEYKGEYEDNEH